MADNNHATKADLNALRDEFKADLNVLRDEVKTDIASLRDELVEVIRGVETNLLKAFYGFAETTQQRLTQDELNTRALAERMATMERRMTELEKRVNFPGAPS